MCWRIVLVYLFVCLFGALRRINPRGSLASEGIKLNMMWMEKVRICKMENKRNDVDEFV